MKKTSKQPSVALESLGCKLNQAELQLLAGQLAAAGYSVVGADEKADIYILNTCTVTHVADRKSRHLLNMARRRNPAVCLIALGCYAERDPQALSSLEGVELVLGNEQKWRLPELLGGVGPNPFSLIPNPSYRTRAFLKIQDGCQNYCAYCIVPLVRSKVFSVPAAEVVAQIKAHEAAGFKEVVLTGTEVGAYDYTGLDLKDLLKRILKETAVPRIRLSSLQPCHITLPIIALWRDNRLCSHFHLSLQSGSGSVLKRMKRRYSVADYGRAVELIRESIPDAAITTDVIVGFPGETDAEFKETYDCCRKMQFARIHVFSYSSRPGTAAATMVGQVPEKVKKERSAQMLALAKESTQVFRKRFIGKTSEVLWEQQAGGIWTGLTGNYIKVHIKNAKELTNVLLPVNLVKLYRDGVWGDV